ncbi:MAG: hypothetical protein WC205_09670 [Opitutaceae bacterium]|jgi:4-hydroxybenzoate polyprenyltransferase
MNLQPPEDESPPPPSTSGKISPVALAAFGFVAAPLMIAATIPLNSPAPALLCLAGAFVMLFFRSTRAFGLGFLLFVGVAFLVLLAICGHSSF